MTPLHQFVITTTEYAQANNHRYLVVLSGEEQWATTLLEQLLIADNCLWLGDGAWPDTTAMNKAGSVLGREYQHLVFNSYSGFNPDAFGQSVGTVAGGGICFLITPEFKRWPQYQDPDYLRYLASPEQRGQTSANFIRRTIRLIEADSQSVIINQHQSLPSFVQQDNTPIVNHRPEVDVYSEQQLAVEQILKTVTGHRNRPLVITADRGRGKSSALGIAAAQLLKRKLSCVTVTAPNRKALDSLFKHAALLLDGATISKRSLQWQGKEIRFIAPDELTLQLPDCELLLIDEAAAIPTPMLTILAKHYSRVVFATTIHGYEGTGRGFSLRFVKTLEKISPSWRAVELTQPIRWAKNDPLEAISNILLGLDFKEVNSSSCIGRETGDDLEFQILSQQELVDNEPLLQQAFSLLVSAHYQTKPSDFRQLLDAPHLTIFVARHHGDIVATALVLREGELADDLCQDIWMGTRRLRGHLLAQSLVAQVGLEQAGSFSYARIMRIAVHPSLQSKGIGKIFEQKITDWAGAAGFDFIGASFGATAQLTRYWLSQNYHALRLGLTKDRASGTHALLVLKSLQQTPAADALLVQTKTMFARALRYSISGEFNRLEQELLTVLLSTLLPQMDSASCDIRNLTNYTVSERPLEQVDYLLEAFIWQQPHRLSRLSLFQQRLIVSKILQKHTWPQVVSLVEAVGKNKIKTELKQAIAAMLGD